MTIRGDYSVGDDERGTGYDVLVRLDDAMVLRGFLRPAIDPIPRFAERRRK